MLENPEICSLCKGKCCKELPGCCFPEDFGEPLEEKAKIALASGKYAIDWWEGDPRENQEELSAAMFIRPAIKGKEGILADPSWGGECTFLTKMGCSLPADSRPTGCKTLEPKRINDKTLKCVGHPGSDKREAAIAWIPYQEFLSQIKGEDYESR